jgi:hypothetical protein
MMLNMAFNFTGLIVKMFQLHLSFSLAKLNQLHSTPMEAQGEDDV